jgi:hypothetical protein
VPCELVVFGIGDVQVGRVCRACEQVVSHQAANLTELP